MTTQIEISSVKIDLSPEDRDLLSMGDKLRIEDSLRGVTLEVEEPVEDNVANTLSTYCGWAIKKVKYKMRKNVKV
jgi:hypothetical protein